LSRFCRSDQPCRPFPPIDGESCGTLECSGRSGVIAPCACACRRLLERSCDIGIRTRRGGREVPRAAAGCLVRGDCGSKCAVDRSPLVRERGVIDSRSQKRVMEREPFAVSRDEREILADGKVGPRTAELLGSVHDLGDRPSGACCGNDERTPCALGKRGDAREEHRFDVERWERLRKRLAARKLRLRQETGQLGEGERVATRRRRE
jgi:hypothetical protein